MNYIILMGNLVADPELRTTASGAVCCRFRIAVNRPKSKEGGSPEADFFQCVAWNKLAEVINQWFHKGERIVVVGSMRNNNYTDANGVKHYSDQVLVKEIHFTGSRNSTSTENKENDDSDLIPEDFEAIFSGGEEAF